MTYDRSKLPAIPMPAGEQGKEIQPNGTSQHIIIDTDRSFLLAPIPEDKQELMQWRGHTTYTRRQKVGLVGGYTIEISPLFFEISKSIEHGISAVGAVLFIGTILGPPMYNIRKMSKQKRIINASLETQDALRLPKTEIGVHIPRTLLQTSVLFQSENGLAEVPAYTLMESIGSLAPGIRGVETTHDMVDYRIAPGRLASQSLSLVNPDRQDTFLAATRPAMSMMHRAAQQLAPAGILPSTPESMRPALEQSARDLLLGALGVYGVLRSEVSPIIATKVSEFYATQEKDHQAIRDDALRLQFPTSNNISWQEIANFQAQVG